MPDPVLRPRSALNAPLLAPDLSGSAAPGLLVAERDGLRLLSIMARAGRSEEVRGRLRGRFGLELPDGPRRCVAGTVAAVGTAPGAWLLSAETERPGFAAEVAALLDDAAAVADQSDAFVTLRLSGPALRDVLAKGVAIDLHPASFPPGAAAVTLVSHMGLMLWRVDAGADHEGLTLDVAAARSSFGSFWNWLAASAAEYGLRLAPPQDQA